MATVESTFTPVEQIGETAGVIWHVLDKHEALSLTRLIKACGLSRDLVMQGLGWLAREDKVHIEETTRGKLVSLR